MRKVAFSSVILCLVVVLAILLFGTKKPMQREGIDKQLAEDSLEVARIIYKWNNELNIPYDELNSTTKDIIDDYDYKNYYGDNEEPSDEEREIVETTYMMIVSYDLNGREISGETRYNDNDIAESKERIEELTKDVVNE
ncbi:hypothetical protein GCM10011409_37850 [Lentibacillus populi]|uniref:Uncharacterized protein n=1 Tax=Lentibacillus populi TaxID=1827502 RepID=A0A9W5U1C7_9BACI|nr:hypothetical protein [Lentibacillus populi]GGB56721.1 hypothetical protein GCM10011409_37850 [Lentibacillus populi]